MHHASLPPKLRLSLPSTQIRRSRPLPTPMARVSGASHLGHGAPRSASITVVEPAGRVGVRGRPPSLSGRCCLPPRLPATTTSDPSQAPSPQQRTGRGGSSSVHFFSPVMPPWSSDPTTVAAMEYLLISGAHQGAP